MSTHPPVTLHADRARDAGRAQPTPTAAGRAPELPGVLRGFRHQFRYDLRVQLRNPVAVFFTVFLPLAFMIMFTVLAGGDAEANARRYVPATMVIGLLSGTISNLSITLAYLREYGMLRHVLVTPLPRASYLGSRVASAGLLAMVSTLVLALTGAVLYGVAPTRLDLLVLSCVAGTVSGSAIGVALGALVRNEVAATPVANAVTLPLLVASGAFFSLDRAPAWIRAVSEWLPAEPVVRVAIAGYGAEGATSTAVLELLAVTGAWTAIACLVARRWFTWTPRSRR